jgi:hypothetical protein
MGPGDRERGTPAPRVARPGPVFAWSVVLWVSNSVTWWASPVVLVSMGFSLFTNVLSRMAPFCYVSPVSSFYFYIYIISTGTSGNMSVAQVYVCMNVYFPLFWNYVGGIDVSITTTNTDQGPRSSLQGRYWMGTGLDYNLLKTWDKVA